MTSRSLSKTILRRLLREDSLKRRRAERNQQTSSAFAAQRRATPRPVCTHRKKPGHLSDFCFCVQPGGKMADRSIADARVAPSACIHTIRTVTHA